VENGNTAEVVPVISLNATLKISLSLLLSLLLHTLRVRRHCLNGLFLTQVYSGFKFSLSILEIVGLRVPARNIKDCTLFSACSTSNNCPSAGLGLRVAARYIRDCILFCACSSCKIVPLPDVRQLLM
jgi:hypothetical protein